MATTPRTGTSQRDELARLRKIEGQVRGVQRMIEEDRYCIDILTQIRSIVGALGRVSDAILERHLRHCVTHAVRAGSDAERDARFEELMAIIRKAR